MSEYRQDPLSRRWVIVGSDRGLRPNEFVEEPVRRQPVPCPFCAGHEHETPAAVAEYSASGESGWLVRVVPNKYPAVTIDQDLSRSIQPLGGATSTEKVPGFGRHEVIIESPRHVASFSQVTPRKADLVFQAYRYRIVALKETGHYRHVQIFRNVGPGAGASLEHIHSQLVALPGVPEVVARELTSCRDYFAEHGRGLVADLIQDELAQRDRVFALTDQFVAFCPYASRFPYEVCIAPLRAEPAFEAAQPGEISEVSRLVRDVIGRIERAAGPVAYNCILHTQPFDTSPHDHYHWHIEIIPRLTKVAGFELGTGCFINPLPPEVAAAQLRSYGAAEMGLDSSD